ncbi:hypothetical protein MQM1_09 [Aeromonas phage vB_AsaP_MQM1]|nr:hypothetical protein MQM1_09 [Aeromonas phage vB_AsaP_MQM1]
MTSIRVPDTISKLNPADTYPVVEGADVSGFMDLKSELNDNTSKIEANILNIKNLTKSGKTTVVNNSGDSTPQFDSEPHGNYLVVQRGQTSTVTIETPDPTGGMLDGSILTIYNESPTQAVRVIPGDPADSLNSASAINIPAENFASFVYRLKDRNFLLLESGYIPAARVNIANYVEQKLDTDGKLHTLAELDTAGYLRGIKATGEGLSAVQSPNWIHFIGAAVTQGKPGQVEVHIPTSGIVDPTKYVLHFQTIAERNQWSTAEGSKYIQVVCVVDADSGGDIAWFKWTGSAWAALDVDMAGHSITKEYSVVWGAPDIDGISTATIDTSTDFGTKAVDVRILKDIGGGYYEHISTSTIEISTNATSVRMRTDSGSVIAATLVVEVTGVSVV